MSKCNTEINNISAHEFQFSASTAQKSAPPSRPQKSSTSDSGDETDREESDSSHRSTRKSSRTILAMRRPSIMAAAALKTQHYGSFYLRMGAVGNYAFLLRFMKPQNSSVYTQFTFHIRKPQNFLTPSGLGAVGRRDESWCCFLRLKSSKMFTFTRHLNGFVCLSFEEF